LPLLLALCLCAFLCEHAKANPPKKPKSSKNQIGPDFGKGGEVRIELITNYYPTKNDSMNGSCGRGGGTAPKDPCKHLLEDVVDGKSPCVVGATQQSGGSAPLYGCVTVVPHVSNVVGRDINVCFADVYAGSENEGSISRGKRQPSKFDLAVKENSKMGARIQAASASPIQVGCNGRVPNTQNKDQRPIERDPDATSPMPQIPSMPSPPSDASKSPLQPAGPADMTAATSPTPASTNSSAQTNTGVKIGSGKVASSKPAPAGPAPEKISMITKDDNRTFPSGIGSISDDLLKMASTSAATSPGAWKSASSGVGSGGSLGGSGDSSSSGPVTVPGAEAKPLEDPSSSQAGGGGGGGGGGSSGSPFSADTSKNADAAVETPLENTESQREDVAAGTEENSRDPASEVVDGVGAKYGLSVFERVHGYFSRERRGRAP